MWELISNLFTEYGITALISVGGLSISAYLFTINQRLQREIIKLYEKRLVDVSESKEDYAELAHKLDQSIDLLIKVFKRNGG